MKAKTPDEKTIEKEQFDKDGNLVCPTCKKPLKGLHTYVTESLIALDKHTTQKHKVQCCSEECTAKFYDKQLKNLKNKCMNNQKISALYKNDSIAKSTMHYKIGDLIVTSIKSRQKK